MFDSVSYTHLHRSEVDLVATRRICERLFSYRKAQEWPPIVSKKAGWDELYAEQASDLPVLDDVDSAIDWVNDLICLLYTSVVDPASFTRPGGGYEDGSFGPEQILCSESNLYPILYGLKSAYHDGNRGCQRGQLFTDRALDVYKRQVLHRPPVLGQLLRHSEELLPELRADDAALLLRLHDVGQQRGVAVLGVHVHEVHVELLREHRLHFLGLVLAQQPMVCLLYTSTGGAP